MQYAAYDDTSYDRHSAIGPTTAGINRSNTAVRAVLEQPCSTGGRTGTVRPKQEPTGRTDLSDRSRLVLCDRSQELIGQACPTRRQVLRSDSACPTTGRTRLFEHRSNCRVRPVNAGSPVRRTPQSVLEPRYIACLNHCPECTNGGSLHSDHHLDGFVLPPHIPSGHLTTKRPRGHAGRSSSSPHAQCRHAGLTRLPDHHLRGAQGEEQKLFPPHAAHPKRRPDAPQSVRPTLIRIGGVPLHVFPTLLPLQMRVSARTASDAS
ncbi:hypothetical protein PCASD_25781 [Puccinia coronata f. sp. avenae]|uniref:Uncharacterized protein n=1 Tax=Puccinia coronata f. sp. avenae TaxID=200324 RepID=A0A2N5TJL1_9BASI|nr:hypothetical protein PCASD_25781 [Puccinia coronata f. sp. avenae]